MNLSIIIPTYNRNSSVVECALALEHNKAEIIVVDDGSDQPVVLPAQTARWIRHDRHRGRSAAINTGLKAATHDAVLIVDDDIYASPEMVARLFERFQGGNNRSIGLIPRIVWDPDLPLTLTMNWMEQNRKFPTPMLLWKPFVLRFGGYDENFSRRLEDIELQLRLKRGGIEFHTIDSATGYQNHVTTIRDLIEREFMDGVSAVFLHSKFPEFMPEIDDTDLLNRNEAQVREMEGAVEEISMLEQSGSCILPAGASELYSQVARHYFLHGVFEGLRDIGGMKPRRNNTATVAIYQQAARLQSIGELDEARRLFRLVLHRQDREHWDGAEYHLGCIETGLGNPDAARSHFVQCLRLNPGHNQARRELNRPALFREVEPNVFESVEPARTTRVLFIVFGDLRTVVQAFPVMAALRERFHCETAWLTSPEYASLARASFADTVRETEHSGMIPWDWVHAEGFTHVFFPEPAANQEEWAQSGLHAIDFMAAKCGVALETHQSWLDPNPDAVLEAEEFLRQNRLVRGSFITAAHGTAGTTATAGKAGTRHWPSSNLMKLAQKTQIPVVVFGRKGDLEIPHTIPCFDKPFEIIAALIRWSAFYLGPDSGISWLATTTNTPMAVFLDPASHNHLNGYRAALEREKKNVREWDIYTNLQTVAEYVESMIPKEAAGAKA